MDSLEMIKQKNLAYKSKNPTKRKVRGVVKNKPKS